MWSKVKAMVFHRAVQHGAATATATVLALLSRPEVMTALLKSGITIDPDLASKSAVTAVVFLLTVAYHGIRKKVESLPGGKTAATPTSK